MNGSTSSSERPASAPKPDSAPVRFTLDGPSRAYDPVHQAIRPDLADVAEASHHFAPHYAQAVMCRASVAADVRETASDEAPLRTSLAVNDGFALLDLSGGWAWGYAIDGHIVGYVRRELLELA